MKLRVAGSALLAALVSFVATVEAQTPGRINRESVDSNGDQALGDSGVPSLSADGRYVAFASDAANLVPNDNNDDTDIFVRDRETGVVQRVSVAWNGMEARDDSWCPAISGDGRYVAFISEAWNMYPGGANLGHPRRDVYVHDRQTATTTHITTGVSGDPDGDSGCPSISGNGRLVAFSSAATNIVSGDQDGVPSVFLHDTSFHSTRLISAAPNFASADGESTDPAISSDGKVVVFVSRATNLLPDGAPNPPHPQFFGLPNVFAYDVESEAVELVSQSLLHPQFAADDSVEAPAVSADGRYVAFESKANNLVDLQTRSLKHVYVRDRVAGTTTIAGLPDPTVPCPRGDEFCRRGTNHGAAISGDGRFVAFASGSGFLLPANLHEYGSNIYLFDRIGGRLRRLSVDQTGRDVDACSEEASLSGDGKLVAYRSAKSLVPDDTNGADDVLSNDWTCNPAGRCHTLASCPAEPLDCEDADSSFLRLRKHPPGGVRADQLFWRWNGPAAAGPFPDPAGAGLYQICVYANALAFDVAAPEGPACSGSERPCWASGATHHKLVNPNGGLTSLRVSSTPDGSRIVARGSGSLLDAPYLPLFAPQGVIAQLQDTGSGRCWQATFPTSSIKYNIPAPASVGSQRYGRFVARLQ